MVNKLSLNITCFLIAFIFLGSCKKYLETKPNQGLATPSSVKELQALLDNPMFYSTGTIVNQSSSDDYYVPFNTWNSATAIRKWAYNWDANLDDFTDWQAQYRAVFYANTVIDAIPDINGDASKLREIEGAGLFHRAYKYFQLLQLYAPQYDPATSATDLGIVLRTDANFTKTSQRATVQQSYDQVINDLARAVTLLPESAGPKTRPNKVAGFALLAKTYLQIGEYEKAIEAASQALQLYNQLIDYNDQDEINPAQLTNPIVNKGIAHKEIIFYLYEPSSFNASSSAARIDTNLYRSYDDNDIRKKAFFRPITSGFTDIDPADHEIYRFKGSYSPEGLFVGLSTPELYLIRAECNARLGNVALALQDLNDLLFHRYLTGTFSPIDDPTAEGALKIILIERRKEMLYRGMRWADLRRLNKNPSTSLTVKRLLDGKIHSLPPNDYRYTLLIPKNVMDLTDLPQNPR